MNPPETVQVVRCRWCNCRIALNVDSYFARAQHTDPHSQLCQHIASCMEINKVLHGFETALVTVMLAFENDRDPERWRASIAALVDYTLKQPAGQSEPIKAVFQDEENS